MPGGVLFKSLPCVKGGGPAQAGAEGLPSNQFLRSGLPAWRGRSAGPDFSPMRNRGKNRQRRGLPPPCGIHPAVLGGGCAFLFSALGLVGSHRRRGNSTGSIYSSDKYYFYCQGFTLVSRCSQRSAARLPAAGTPLSQGRPGCENHQAVGPAAQGGLVWWQN